MATTDRRQTLADHIGPSKSRLNEAKTARRRITNDSGRTHGRDHDHDFDVNTDPFTTGRRSTHVYNPNLSRTPAPRYPQSTARQQRVSTREENHVNPFQDHLRAYKTQLVDDLNAQMTRADDEITQNMDDLSEDFEGRLKVIETAGGMFWSKIGEERIEIGTGEGTGENAREEVSLQQVMTDFETLMAEKRARLKELTTEYIRIGQESVKLAITILGQDKVSLIESASESVKANNQTSSTMVDSESGSTLATNPTRRETMKLLIDLTAAKETNESFEQVYDDAEAGLMDIGHTLDELVAKNLEENKAALKAFQAGRKVKQGELSKLLSSWTLS